MTYLSNITLVKFDVKWGAIVLLLAILSFVSCQEEENVTIGKQVWATRNLNVRTFRNGDSIYFARNEKEWRKGDKQQIPMCCYPYYDSVRAEELGLLYNWLAVSDKRGLAPAGYRIPTVEDWNTLIHFCGGNKKAGKALKSVDHWYPSEDDVSGEDMYGFRALACPKNSGKMAMGNERFAFWWTKTADTSDGYHVTALRIIMYHDSPNCYPGAEYKSWAMSVRCLKN